MTDESNKEEQLDKNAQKLLEEIKARVKSEDVMYRNLRIWLSINKDNTYY